MLLFDTRNPLRRRGEPFDGGSSVSTLVKQANVVIVAGLTFAPALCSSLVVQPVLWGFAILLMLITCFTLVESIPAVLYPVCATCQDSSKRNKKKAMKTKKKDGDKSGLAPLTVPLKRRKEMAWVLVTLLSQLWALLFTVLLLIFGTAQLRALVLIYSVWCYFDKTPERGGYKNRRWTCGKRD